jgi:triacylglycerol lipase
MSVLHPLWFPKLVLDAAAENGHAEDKGFSGADYEGNDGLVSVSSARWGEFIGAVDPCHHWDLRGEGGLWPQGPTLEKKPQGKPDSNAPDGWDWQGNLGDQLGLGLSSTSSKAEQTQRDADKVKETIKGKINGDSSSWDIAQVGQVLDWVMDLLPGGKGTETEKRSLANAKKEKEPKEDQSGFITTADGTKRRKDKFDLARFYGGLMLKLKDDGF